MDKTFVVDVRGVPEVVWACRHRLAEILRDVAKQEDRVVAERLAEIAAEFEAGR